MTAPSKSLLIRDPLPGDEAAWRRLWAGYCAFYEKTVPETVTAYTWTRIATPGGAMLGRVALWEGDVAGFTVSVLHEGSWTLHPICYLEDLFVDEKARGHGIGRTLIADLLSLAKERGWSRLYWHTRARKRAGPAPLRRVCGSGRFRPLPHRSRLDGRPASALPPCPS